MRTTSGTWRVAHDFPNLPAWIVKSVGGSTVHWAGASLRFQEHEFKARTHLRRHRRRQPARLADHARRDGAVVRQGRGQDGHDAAPTAFPRLPGNNNYKVLEAGARKLGYKEVHTGNMSINSQPRDGRGACQQIGFCFQGCKSGAQVVDAVHRDSQGRGDRQSRGAAERDGAADRARCARQGHRRGLCRRRTASSSGRRPASWRSRAIRWKARACC